MLRRCMGAAVILIVLGGFVAAESIRGVITKTDIKDGKGTITVKVFKKGEKGSKGTSEEKTFKVTSATKFAKKGKGKDAEPESVKVDDFTKAVDDAASSGKGRFKGVFGKIETKDDTDEVTSITYGGGFRGRGKGKRGGGDKSDK
jgi:hypothetical protein